MSEAEEQNNKRSKGKGADPTRSFNGSVVGPGSQIGPFRIEQELGRGGAGVVYLAHDTKLDRSVAIKSLPPEVKDNPKALSRFTREARVLASLNHPNIATIHEVLEEADGLSYLVLEYVPGQTLAERIAKKPLKLEEALIIAQQIAETVATAHEHDVIHRDLKPGNIKITEEGKVKVLDFGLAKVVGGEATDQQTTITEPGRVIGTPAYMSPEQARGKLTDKRSDIWSFGCVLYEMLTAIVPFKGETISDTLANILQTEPRWEALPENIPINIRSLLRHCLKKDPRRRLQHIGDAAIEISEALSQPFKVSVESHPSRRVPWKVAALGVFVGLVVGAIAMLEVMRGPTQSSEPKPVKRYSINLDPENPFFPHPVGASYPNFTPDGLQLIYVAGTSLDNRCLFRRSLDSLNAEKIQGTDGASHPQISPDGQWLAFSAQSVIWKVPLAGGNPERIADNPINTINIWEDKNTLILSTMDGLSRFNLKTGKQEFLTTLDPMSGYAIHCPIQLYQETGTLIFIKARTADIDDTDLFAMSLETDEVKPLVKRAWGVYAPSGHLIYLQRGRLMAAPFDTKTLQITGDAINITEQRMVTDETIPNLSFSAKGTLVYVPHEGHQEQNRDLVWVDLDGQEEPLEVPPKEYESVRMSRDIAHPQVVAEVDGCIWIYNTSGASPIRPLTLDSEGICISPVWIPPDNHEIVFYSRDSNNLQIKRKAVDGTGEAEVISAKSSKWFWFAPFTCTPDGKVLLAAALRSEKTPAIWDRLKIHLDREGEVEPLLELKNSAISLALSPDGKWLAYVCDEQGRNEVFVTSWPDLKRNRLISTETEGGKEPVWAPDSKTIYYRGGTKIVAVTSVSEGGFTPGRAQYLFDDVYQPGFITWGYDIHPDGKRFLMIKKAEEQEKAPITELIVVENWFEELKRRVPTGEN